MLFIDFQKAYDTINRQKLWYYLLKNGIPEKLVRLTKMCIAESTCKVRINDSHTSEFSINAGVRQGDGLSPLLFNIALDEALRKTKEQTPGIKLGTKINVLAFADDVALISEDPTGLQQLAEVLINEAKLVGLEISESKTKYMVVGRNVENSNRPNLNVGNKTFQRCNEFKYLGFTINQSNEEDHEINLRIASANKSYWALDKLFKSKILSRNTKVNIYKTIIQPVLLYGVEIWVLSKSSEKKLIIFENKILRRIFGPIQEDGIWRSRKNKEIRTLYNQPDIVAQARSRRLRWMGHVLRKEEESQLKKVIEETPEGSRPRGRPRLRWFDQVEKDVRKMGITIEGAQDRRAWRHVVDEAKNQLGFQWPWR